MNKRIGKCLKTCCELPLAKLRGLVLSDLVFGVCLMLTCGVLAFITILKDLGFPARI